KGQQALHAPNTGDFQRAHLVRNHLPGSFPTVGTKKGRQFTSFRDYAKRIEEAILRDVGTFGVESKLIERRGVSDELEKAQKRGLRYVCVVGRQNESKNTLNLHILRPMGKTESKKCILIKFTS